MAELFQQTPKEVCIYINRHPKKDGSDPQLGWVWVVGGLFCLHLLVLLVLIVTGFFKLNIFAICAEVVVLAIFGHFIITKFKRIIFSLKMEEIYSATPFSRKKLAAFSDIDEIRLQEQEIKGKKQYRYVGVWWDNKLREPLPISPRVDAPEQLVRYEQVLIPMLKNALGFAGDAPPPQPEGAAEEDSVSVADVSVEPIEVPIDDAEAMVNEGEVEATIEEVVIPIDEAKRILSDTAVKYAAEMAAAQEDEENAERSNTKMLRRQGTGKKGTKTKLRPKKRIFKQWGGIYSRSFWLEYYGFLLVVATIFFGTVHFMEVRGLTLVPYLNYLVAMAIIAGVMFTTSKRNMNLKLNTNKRTIEFRTMFGLRNNVTSFQSLNKITLKHISGIKYLCMVLDDLDADPVAHIAITDQSVQMALDELCEFMELDPRLMLKL